MSLPALQQTTNFMIAPRSMSEAMDFAKMIANSDLCPPGMKGKPGNVIIAMQMGAEVGLSPMQALQNIAVINSRPCLYGDAALAVVQAHPLYVSHNEWLEGSEKEGTLTAYCSITRKGQEEYIKTFSQKEADKAGLWGKAGPWKQYPTRMLQLRARAFAIRDKFADALRGIRVAEEVSDYERDSKSKDDYQVVDISSKQNKSYNVPAISSSPAIIDVNVESDDLEIQFVEFKESLSNCENEESLKSVFDHIKKSNFKSRPDLFKQLIDIKDQKKSEIMAKTAKIAEEYFNDEQIDEETGEIKNA